MDIKQQIKNQIIEALEQLNVRLDVNDIIVEQCKDTKNGDYSTNVALKYATKLGYKPHDFALLLKEKIVAPFINKIEIAGPGFINFFVAETSIFASLKNIIEQGDNYGRGEKKDYRINVEFVSANPTGDLHLGHARIASYGDSMCRLYEFAGYDVTREYYVNDGGHQVDNLALSLKARYHQLFDKNYPMPEDGYYGEDIVDIAKKIKEKDGNKFLAETEENLAFFKRYGIDAELNKIKTDLDYFRVHFDVFTYESDIRANNRVADVLNNLYKNYTYELDGAVFLKTTDFLDDKDRPVVKSDGSYTYLMPDIVYHLDKMSRGYDLLIDLLGADHHGYINRLKSAMMMQGYKKESIEVELVQMVRLIKDGEEVKMSKRTGNAISLRELCDEVGVDAVRYFFVARDAMSHLDFNLNLATEHSEANPVFYCQYAHARLCRMLELSKDIAIDLNGTYLGEASEVALAKALISFPSVVQTVALQRKPNKITTYIQSLATLIHEFYTECRVIDREHLELCKSRLALVLAAKIVMKNALNLLGLSAPNNM